MTPVAPRNVNSVSFVTRITHEIYFSWQAHYLVKLVQSSTGVVLCSTE